MTSTMYIVPYTYSCSNPSIGGRRYHVIDLLVQGGTALWAEEASDINPKALLASNDIYTVRIDVVGSMAYAKVDTQATRMGTMYRWPEVPSSDKDTLCWRRFYHVTEGDRSWLPVLPPFGPLLDYIVRQEAKG